ncbi:MAG: hypothetical protein HOM32_09130, partial [Planctomycetaceae bacterium]|nr:hypothetical protein [Planctomycetaceae bacterium]
MSDLFNPYIEFLDLDTAPKCPTYYELLGISNRDECTHDRVENGRIAALAKMRTFKPGANAGVWAAVLDEVSLASKTLLDANLKATYDNQLTTGEVPSALSLVARLGPIVRIDAGFKASVKSASPVDSMAPSHLQSGAVASVRVAAAHPVVPTAVAVPVAAPIATVAPEEVATQIARTIPPLPDAVGPSEQLQSGNQFNGLKTKRKRRRSSRKTRSPLLLYATIGLFLIVGGGAFVFMNPGNQRRVVSQQPSDPQLAKKPSKPNDLQTTSNTDAPTIDQPKVRPPAPPIEKPLDTIPTIFLEVPEKPSTDPPTEPMPTEPMPIEPAELEKLSVALKLGREALSERNLDIAAEQLVIAEPLARSGEPQKAFIRLKTMHEFLVQFMRLSNEAIDKYESGDEIRISESNAVVVVETSPQDLT